MCAKGLRDSPGNPSRFFVPIGSGLIIKVGSCHRESRWTPLHMSSRGPRCNRGTWRSRHPNPQIAALRSQRQPRGASAAPRSQRQLRWGLRPRPPKSSLPLTSMGADGGGPQGRGRSPPLRSPPSRLVKESP